MQQYLNKDLMILTEPANIDDKEIKMSSSSPEPLQSLHPNDDGGHFGFEENHHPKKMMCFKYMECLKNHAAHMGRNATDGCGEFIPDGEQGTIEALKCSACDCHRNFHRRIQLQAPYYPPPSPSVLGQPSQLVVKTSVSGAVDFSQQMSPKEDGEIGNAGKKRYRTMFTQEQKEKMLSFAEKANWKMPKIEDSEARAFCQEIGIKRKVLKVWMHNNKVKKNNDDNETAG